MINISDEIKLTNGCSAKILSKIGEGGQGVVYKVSINNKEYALKWYTEESIINNDKFYENLSKNINKGTPSDKFLWPLYLTEKYDGSFGYVMNLRPEGYNEFSEFLVAKNVFFSSFRAIVNAAINISKAFVDLHRKGYAYQDLNDGNFFINKDTGDVLICDNDNVAPNGENLGVKGKARYMAPEIVRNITRPNNHSDRYSLSVILFELLFFSHPLEGERVLKCPCLTEEKELLFYGKEPIFVYDPNNNQNRPVSGVHNNAITYWNFYPQFIKDKFIKAFSQNSIQVKEKSDSYKQYRILDSDWYKTFVSLKQFLIKCSCSEEVFVDLIEDKKCLNKKCSKKFPCVNGMSFQNDKYIVPLLTGVQLKKCMTSSISDDIEEVTGEIVSHPTKTGVIGLKNLDIKSWRYKLDTGEEKVLDSGKSVTLGRIVEFYFDNNTSAKVINNSSTIK